MPRWPSFRRPSISRPQRRGWVQPGNAITRAIERELETGLPAEPDPVPALVVPDGGEERAGGRPSSAA